jgi:predicted negative regulator of RcsB-dependent stress response
MALDDFDELEQGERVRNWLKQHGGSIVLGIGVGLAGVFGWQYWERTQDARMERAQMAYSGLVEAKSKSDADAVVKAAETLRTEFGKTPYGALTAMHQARDAMDKGDVAAADEALTWAKKTPSSLPVLNEVVALRLAQLALNKGEAKQALDLLAVVRSEGLAGVSEDLRGDALVALDRKDEARAAYDKALGALDAGSVQRTFVEMKRDDLEVASADAAIVPATAPPAAPAAADAEKDKANS